jgi:hypothetical protein
VISLAKTEKVAQQKTNIKLEKRQIPQGRANMSNDPFGKGSNRANLLLPHGCFEAESSQRPHRVQRTTP